MHEEKDLFALTKREILPFSLTSFLVGAIASLAICFYMFLYMKILEFSSFMYALTESNLGFFFLQLVVVLAIGVISFLIISRLPFLIGSGIPQAIGIMQGKFTKYKIFYIPIVFFLTLGSVFCGLPYGYEGPTIFIGGLSGGGGARLLRKQGADKSMFTGAGISAAFCTVFNAPLSAVTFTLEEGSEKLSTKFLVSTGIAVVTAALIRRAIFGSEAVFSMIKIDENINLLAYLALLILAITVGVIAPLFNKILLLFRKIPAKLGKKALLPLYLLPFVLAFFLSAVNRDLLYSGDSILRGLPSNSLLMILGLLIARFLLISLTMSGRNSGGLFLPSLIQGAMIGYLVANLFLLCGMDKNAVSLLVLTGMLGYFTAMTKAPLTACLLAFELTGSVKGIIPTIFVIVIAFIISEFISKKCLYADILDDLTSKNSDFFTLTKKDDDTLLTGCENNNCDVVEIEDNDSLF